MAGSGEGAGDALSGHEGVKKLPLKTAQEAGQGDGLDKAFKQKQKEEQKNLRS